MRTVEAGALYLRLCLQRGSCLALSVRCGLSHAPHRGHEVMASLRIHSFEHASTAKVFSIAGLGLVGEAVYMNSKVRAVLLNVQSCRRAGLDSGRKGVGCIFTNAANRRS